MRRATKPRRTSTTRAPAPTEAQMQAGLLACARRLGFLAMHIADSRQSEPGFPDTVVVGFRTLLLFELKTQRGKLRPATVTKAGRWLPGQQDWLDAFREAGIPAFVVRPAATRDAISYDQALNLIQRVAGQEQAAER